MGMQDDVESAWEFGKEMLLFFIKGTIIGYALSIIALILLFKYAHLIPDNKDHVWGNGTFPVDKLKN